MFLYLLYVKVVHSNTHIPRIALPASCCRQSSSFSDMTKLNNEERHTQPLKTALNSRVPQNPTSAGEATRAGRGGGAGEKKRRKLYNCSYFSQRLQTACQWSETTREHWATQTGLLCPPQTPAIVPKLTLATVYNPPHTIRQDIKVRETYLYFLWSKEKKKITRPSAKLR